MTTPDDVKAAAQSIVRQWDEHDRFRVCEGESSDEPAEVAVARAYLSDLDAAEAEIESLRTALAEAERDAARYRLIAKVVRPKREREPEPGWMDWVVPTARCDSFEEAIEHQATKELAEMQHRMRAAIREEMRNPTETSKGET